MKVKTTRRAFAVSCIVLLICISMLVGTTFAWFTDSASTKVNKIQSGILQIDIAENVGTPEAPVFETLQGDTLEWVKSKEAPETEDLLWEPGVTYELEKFYIVNKDEKQSNLALKYSVEITGIIGDSKLLEAIDFTISDGENPDVTLEAFTGVLKPNTDGTVSYNGPYTITGHMKEEAGNEYQDLNIDGIAITVYATQLNYEYDSTTNAYDEKATYGTYFEAMIGDVGYTTVEKAIAAAKTGETIKLMKDRDSSLIINKAVAIDGNGFKIDVDDGNAITIDASDVKLENVYAESGNGIALVVNESKTGVTIDGGEYKTSTDGTNTGKQGEGAMRFMGYNGDVSVKNASMLGGLHFINYNVGTLKVEDNTFAVDSSLAERSDIVCGILIYGAEDVDVSALNGESYLNNNKFSDSTANFKVLIQNHSWITTYSDKT